VSRDDRWLYGWATGYAAVGAASLLVPLYAIELGAGPLLVGLIAATAAFAGVPGAVLWGRLASRTGRRRRFVLIALGATAGMLAVMPLLTTPWLVLAANAGLWFVVAAAAPVLNLVMVESVPADQWESRFGVLNHYQGYGWLAGLLAGAAWSAATTTLVPAVVAQRAFFLLAAAAATAGLGLVRAWYPDRPTTSERRFLRRYGRNRLRSGRGAGRYVRTVPFGPGRAYWAIRAFDLDRARGRFTGRLTVYLAATTLAFVGFATFFGPLPAYLTSAGFGTDQIFALFVLASAGAAATYARVARAASRVGIRLLQTGALTARAVAFPLVGVAGVALPPTVGFPAVGALFVLVGVTWAVVSITATGLVTRLAPDGVRGEALGAYTALGALGGGLGSALGGVAAGATGYVVTFALAGALVLVGAVVGLLSR
jgi:MFS family permease